MLIDSTQFRSFYPQESLNLKFIVSDYTSQDFEIGLSGNTYFRFKFKSGFIKDNSDYVIGSYNGQPISIEGLIETGRYNYSLNSIPVARDFTFPSTAIFTSVVAKILDSQKSINLDCFVYGKDRPTLNFYDFESLGTGLSGKFTVTSDRAYYGRIFDASSSTFSGDWVFPSKVVKNQVYEFFTTGVKSLAVGSVLSLNLDTNFGNQNYTLRVQDSGEGGSAIDDITEYLQNDENQYVSIWPYTGDISQVGSGNTSYYIDYAIGPNHSVDLQFEYFNGKSGYTPLSGNFFTGANYTGTLFAKDGLASGLLYNSSLGLSVNYAWTDSSDAIYAQQAIINYKPANGFFAKYFTGLRPTGYAYLSSNLENFSRDINDTTITSPLYAVDLGGKTGVFTSPTSSLKTYNNIFSYNGIEMFNGTKNGTFKKYVNPGDLGKAHFTLLTTGLSGLFFQSNSLAYSDPSIGDGDSETMIRPYRGTAFGSDVDVTVSGSYAYRNVYVNFSSDDEFLIFKNIKDIDSNGIHTFEAGTSGALISGWFINKNFTYQRSGSDFSLNPATRYKGGDLPNSLIEDSLSVHQRLAPFSNITGLTETLTVYDSHLNKSNLSPGILWSGNNFLATSYNYAYSVVAGTILYNAISFDDPKFLYPLYNEITNTNNNTNLIPQSDGEYYLSREYFDHLCSFENFTYTHEGPSSFFSCSGENPSVGSSSIKFVFPVTQDFSDAVSVDKVLYRFSVLVRDNGYRYLQIAFEDGISPLPNISPQGANEPYSNFDIQTLKSGEYTNYGTSHMVPITANTQDWVRISCVGYLTKNLSRSHIFAELRLVDGVGIDGVEATRKSTVSTSNLKLEFAQPRVEEFIGENKINSNIDSYVFNSHFIKGTTRFSPNDLFSYFLCKINNLNGFFSTYGTDNILYKASDTQKDESIFQRSKTGRLEKYKTVSRDELILISDGNKFLPSTAYPETPEKDYLAAKIYHFFVEHILKITISGTPGAYYIHSDNYFDQVTKNLFCSQRRVLGNNFYSIFVNKESLYIEDSAGTLTQFTGSHSTHGAAITEIIKTIKSKNPKFAKKNLLVLDDGDYFTKTLPIQPFGSSMEVIPDTNLSKVFLKGEITKDTKACIQAGFARYYPDNTDSNSYGFFYETPEFFLASNGSIINGKYNNVFPGTRDLLNDEAEYKIDRALLKASNLNLTRLVKTSPTLNLSVSKVVDEEVFLDKGYFSVAYTGTVPMTGLYPDVNKATNKIWGVYLSDDEDGLVNKQLVVPITPDNYVYNLSGFGINDNQSHVKFLHISHNNHPVNPSGLLDNASVLLTVRSGIQTVLTKKIVLL